jgi:hypothetical protein
MKINTNKILGMIALILLLTSFTTAIECVGQGCGANFSLNVTNGTIITPTQPSILGATIYDLLVSSGAGISSFIDFMKVALPILFVLLALIMIIFAIVYSVFKAIGLWKEYHN